MEKTKTPGVYKRGNRYVVVWRHRGRQHKSFHRTLSEAREAKGRRQSGASRPDTKLRFGQYAEQWISSYAGRTARGFAESSRDLYRRSLNDYALPIWRGWRLGEIEPTDVRRLYGELRDRGVSTSGMRALRAALSALFATATEDGLIDRNPVRGVRIPAPATGKGSRRENRALSRAELGRILAEIPAGKRFFFLFLTQTGLRISEAIALRWEDLVVDGRPRVRVRRQLHDGMEKTLKSAAAIREVPLSPETASRLRTIWDERRVGAETPVFTTSVGTPLNRSNLAHRVLKPAAEDVGLEEWRDGTLVAWPSFHTFRHTCASLLFEQGRNVKQVAEWLGHADPSFTLRTYVHLMDAGVGDAKFFDQAIRI